MWGAVCVCGWVGVGVGGLARGHGVGLFAFGGAYWPLALAHSDPLWVRTCFFWGGYNLVKVRVGLGWGGENLCPTTHDCIAAQTAHLQTGGGGVPADPISGPPPHRFACQTPTALLLWWPLELLTVWRRRRCSDLWQPNCTAPSGGGLGSGVSGRTALQRALRLRSPAYPLPRPGGGGGGDSHCGFGCSDCLIRARPDPVQHGRSQIVPLGTGCERTAPLSPPKKTDSLCLPRSLDHPYHPCTPFDAAHTRSTNARVAWQ